MSADVSSNRLAAMSPSLPSDVGGYLIDGKIGQGGMGSVYGAHHPRIGKRVAIKVLSPHYSANASTVGRFEQEARLVNEIRHPNIVDVFQFGELPDGRNYFVMEWLDGEPLTARIDRGAVPAAETMAILDVICDALEAAHEHGVVHRDLKADNVFLVKGRAHRNVKLLDFGLAKLAGKNDVGAVTRTKSGVVVGTPAYMAPEQARGKDVDGRTDIYALGVLAYKMLTGTLPYKADNAIDLIAQHLSAPVPAANKLARETPSELSRLVVRMMAKSPDERPSLAEVRKTFAELRGAHAAAEAARAAPPRRRATSVLIGLAMFLAGVIALGAIWLVQRDHRSETPLARPQMPALGAPPAAVTAPPAPPALAPIAVAPLAEPAPAAGPASAAIEPTIEFEPDHVARGSGSTSAPAKKRLVEPVAEEVPPAAIVETRPGSLILTLETASSIELDGSTLSPASKGGRFDVAPGHHVIRVKAPGRQPVEREFDVEAGGTAVLRVSDDSGAPEPAGSAAP